MTPRLRIAAIDFLNPAPLMWDFEHPPQAQILAERYVIEKMTPSACASALADGSADIGLIPIAAYAMIPGLAIVPECAIASRGSIRSLLLIVRGAPQVTEGQEPELTPPTANQLQSIRTVAVDTASRTTAIYTQILFRRYWQHEPSFQPHAPHLDSMLQSAEAAVLIGDPALYALRDRRARFARTREPLRYLDLGALWRQATSAVWVSAFWAVRLQALAQLKAAAREQIVTDFAHSREAGLKNIAGLAREWSTRLNLDRAILQAYLGENIDYSLDEPARRGIARFYQEAAELHLLPPVPELNWA